MQILKRTIAVLLLLALCVPILSCANCKMEKPVATCAGYEILYEEVRYLTLNQKELMKKTYGAHIFDTPESAESYRAELEAAVEEMLKDSYAVLAACNYYLPNVKINDDSIQDEVDRYFDQIEDQKAYFKAAEEMYMTENFVRFNMAVAIMKERLRAELGARDICFADNLQEAFFSWIRGGNGAYVQHIFIKNDEGESIEDNRTLAQKIANQLSSGELSLAEAVGSAVYNQDPANLTPYYILRDNDYDALNNKVLEEAALSLASAPAGTVSAPIEADNGFYVFYRVEDSDILLRSKLEELLDQHQKSITERVIAEFAKGLVIEWNDYGKELDLLEIE